MEKSRRIAAVAAVAVGFSAAHCSSGGDAATALETCTESCGNGLICVSGVCKRPVLPTGSCLSGDAHCVASECRDGICVSDGTQPQLTCSASQPCDAKYACSGGICVPKAGAGEKCGTGVAQCRRGTCRDGVCAVDVGPGQSCSATAACPELYECRKNTCLRPVGDGGDCRSSLAFCKDGTCLEGICRAAGGEAADILMTVDTDGDTIADYYDRCDADTDGDTVPDCRDLDSDGDTIPDSRENYEPMGAMPTDSDGDGVYDFMSEDSDSNGIPDAVECKRQTGFDENGDPVYEFIDTDGDTILDCASLDNDGDGISDIDEIYGFAHSAYVVYPDPPLAGDCDGDTIPDPMGTADNPVDCDGDTVPDYLDFDSDGDTIGDAYEFVHDSNSDGFLDRYSQDSDGDGVSDRDEKGADSDPQTPPYAAPGNDLPDYRLYDTDGDALGDGQEADCGEALGHSKYKADADGDGDDDATEYAAAVYSGIDPKEFICNPAKRATDVFDFYFKLPYGGDSQSDNLVFKPSISKLDVVFNVDTTVSMGDEIGNLKENIKKTLVPQIRLRVEDSAFGVTRFDDFPTRGTPNSAYDYNPGMSVTASGYGFSGDLPYERISKPIAASDEAALAQIGAAVDMLGLHEGGDVSESGYEALWQIAMGDDKTKKQVSWSSYENYAEFASGSLLHAASEDGRWGGALWRRKTLPVVLHITDAAAHDAQYQPYDPATVENPHYSDDVHKAYAEKGIRVVSVYTKSETQLPQLVATSQQTGAYVPACAFRTGEQTWRCGSNKCCTVNDETGSDIATDPVTYRGQDVCVLSYAVKTASNLSSSLVDGIDAIVKYSDFSVTAAVRGLPIAGTSKDTSCFIKRIEALQEGGYIAPPQEPERSCNPEAHPVKLSGSSYFNGYENFAVGTSSLAKEGAKLVFKVVAQNDDCAAATASSQVYQAYIDVLDATSQVVLGTQIVSIVVPGAAPSQVN